MAVGESDGTVVLVIDEIGVRKVAASTLKKAGFQVVASSRADASPDLFRKNAHRLRLAVVDTDIDRGDSMAFVRSIQQLVPDLRVLLLSDDSGQEAFVECRTQQSCWIMRKPYRRAQLLGHVLRAIDEPLTLRA